MIYFIIFVLLVWIWLLSEMINAPYVDKYTNTTKNDSATKSNDTYNKDI